MTETPPADALTEVAHPLDGTDPATVADGLAAADPFGAARVVGLGESTHGTSEFTTAKTGVIRHLVAECGCRLVAIEADFAAGFALDEFVATGAGDPRKVLESVHDVWRTAEMVDLLEWLRALNEGRPADERVRVFGYDAQSAAGSADALRGFLQRVDPDLLADVLDPLDVVAGGLPLPSADDEAAVERAREVLEMADSLTEQVRDRIDEAADSYAERASPVDLALARRHLDVIDAARRQRAAYFAGDRTETAAIRERAMADGVDWILDNHHTDRIAVWAHNEHVRTGTRNQHPETPALGQHLRDRYGEDYYALGLEFGTGEWTAASGDPGPPPVESFAEQSVPDDSVAAGLSAVDAPALVLDFAAAERAPAVADWLESPLQIHSIPGIMSLVEDSYVRTRPARSFDGLLYVDEGTAADSLLTE